MRRTSRRSIPWPAINVLSLLRGPPEVDGLPGLALEGQRHLASGPGRLVGREDHLQDRPAVFPGHQRLLVVLNAVHEVGHLAVEAVVPGLLVDREAPALGRAGLL